MWFHFDQSNPGGSFDSSMPRQVFVEAKDGEQANRRAEDVGIYFDGVDNGSDCSCCGDRWSSIWSGEKGEDSVFLAFWERGGGESEKITLDDADGMKRYFSQTLFMASGDYKIQVVPLKGKPKMYAFDAEGMRSQSKEEKRNAAEKLWGVQLYTNGSQGTIIRHFQDFSDYGNHEENWYDKTGNYDLYGKGVGFNGTGNDAYTQSSTFGSKNKKEVQAVKDYWKAMREHMTAALQKFPAESPNERKAKKAFIKVIG